MKAWAQLRALTPRVSPPPLCLSTLAAKNPHYKKEVAREGWRQGEEMHSAAPSPPSTAEHRRHGVTSAPCGAPSWWPGRCASSMQELGGRGCPRAPCPSTQVPPAMCKLSAKPCQHRLQENKEEQLVIQTHILGIKSASGCHLHLKDCPTSCANKKKAECLRHGCRGKQEFDRNESIAQLLACLSRGFIEVAALGKSKECTLTCLENVQDLCPPSS